MIVLSGKLFGYQFSLDCWLASMDRTKDSATEQNVGGSGSEWEVKVQPEVEEGGELNTGALGRFCATRAAGGGSDRLLLCLLRLLCASEIQSPVMRGGGWSHCLGFRPTGKPVICSVSCLQSRSTAKLSSPPPPCSAAARDG